MKRIIALTTTIIVLAALFTSCGNAKKDYSDIVLDVSALASELANKSTYVDELAPVDEELVKTLYGFADTEKTVIYASGGATPEEVIVAEYSSADAAKAGLQVFNDRLSAQKKTYDTYNAQYRPLLDDILLEQIGKYVVYCVSSDNSAAVAAFEAFRDAAAK